MTLIAEPAKRYGTTDADRQRAVATWQTARRWLEMDFDAKRLIGILDSMKHVKIAIVVKEQKMLFVEGSLYSANDGTWKKEGYNGGAVYWWTGDWTTVEKGPDPGQQDPRISLIHEMYHAWQCLFSSGCKALQDNFAVGTDKWFEKQLRVEQACVNFERQVAEGCGTAVRDDYWHYGCKANACKFRSEFAKHLRNASRYFCDSGDFTPTQALLEERYRKKGWRGGPFEPFPG